MSRYLVRERIAQFARIRTTFVECPVKGPIEALVEAPAIAFPEAPDHIVDRNFELPKALYGAMVGLFLAFLGVMWVGFSTPGLAIPMAIFAIFIVAGFGLPAMWTRLAPASGQRPKSVGELMGGGIVTYTGPCSGRDAVIQMLILPTLILGWGVAVTVIAATV